MLDLSLELEPQVNAGQEARQVLWERIGDQLTEEDVQDLMTIVTELVNNAVEHGPGRTIDLRISLDGDRTVRGTVEDRGKGEVAIRAMTEPAGQGGLGLRIVDALADRWGVYAGSTTVWFEFSGASP